MSSGLIVTLWWDEQGTDVAVSVDDRDGGSFQLVVEGCEALHAFYHPYAVAAAHAMRATRTAA
jgi:hypothetical protein